MQKFDWQNVALVIRFDIGLVGKPRTLSRQAIPAVWLVKVWHEQTFVLQPLPRFSDRPTNWHSRSLWVPGRVRVPDRCLNIGERDAYVTFLLDKLQYDHAKVLRTQGQQRFCVR